VGLNQNVVAGLEPSQITPNVLPVQFERDPKYNPLTLSKFHLCAGGAAKDSLWGGWGPVQRVAQAGIFAIFEE
jgi:hypothetical protein